MQKYILLSISVFSILVGSCKKDTTIPVSGTVILSSQLVVDGSSYATYGFSFLSGAIHKYPGEQVDLLLVALKPDSVVTEAYFTAPDYSATFNNTAYNADADSAQNIFNNYSVVTATNFNAVSDNIKVGQIITYKSGHNKYAKILVLSYTLVKQGNDQYAKVSIRWVYQPNGSNKF